MDLGIRGKVALVLAAGGGLGSAISTALANEGATVALCDRDKASGARTVEAIHASGGRAHFFEVDLGSVDSRTSAVASITAQLGGVDIVVNITGGPPPGSASGLTRETWQRYFDEMFVSVAGITDAVLPGMLERRWGRIITSTSSGVIAPIPNLGVSNSIRAGLVGWSKSLAREVAPHGVTVNVVVPGRIATKRVQQLDEVRAQRESRTAEEVARESAASIPMGRYGEPAEYADVVAFLASARASYVTGSIVRVDGGYIASV